MQEISTENFSQLDNRYKTTAIIYLAQIFSTVILIVVALFFVEKSTGALDAISLTALWTAVVFIAVAAFVLRRVFSRWERLKDIKLLKGTSGVFSALQSNAIILGALAETITIIGFIITVLNGEKYDALRAGAVALIVFFINFPRKSVWEKIVANLEKV